MKRLLFKENICHQAIFYSRRVFDAVGKYNLKYKYFADWDLNLRCFRHTELNIKFIDRAIACFSGTGVSSYIRDDEFLQELPIDHITECNKNKEKYDREFNLLRNSIAYRIGSFLLAPLKFILKVFGYK